MKLIFTLFLLFQIQCINAINDYQKGDTLYVWANSGLSFRNSPNGTGEKIGLIGYGDFIVVIDDDTKKYPFKVTEIPFSKKDIHHIGKFEIHGHWVKVNCNGKEGFVFDGYLSKMPTLNIIYTYDTDKVFRKVEDFEFYGRRNFLVLKSDSMTFQEGELNKRESSFHNGITQSVIISNYYQESIKIPNISLEEAYLVANILYNIDYTINNYEVIGDEKLMITVSKNQITIYSFQSEISIDVKNGAAIIVKTVSC